MEKKQPCHQHLQAVPCCGVGVPHCEEQSLVTVPLSDNTENNEKKNKPSGLVKSILVTNWMNC